MSGIEITAYVVGAVIYLAIGAFIGGIETAKKPEERDARSLALFAFLWLPLCAAFGTAKIGAAALESCANAGSWVVRKYSGVSPEGGETP